jgi:ATP-binding cassette, subfamily B, bacterial MsbA
MRNFFRSLRYLRPYRARLLVAVLCVALIAVLWGGGLGMIAPVMKVMIDPEGLHGWAWKTLARGRLEAKVDPRPTRLRVDDQPLDTALSVVKVDEDGPAAGAGIKAGQWLIGIVDEDPTHRVVRGDDLARLLAKLPDEATVILRVHDPLDDQTADVRIVTTIPGWGARFLGNIARRIPEPADYMGRFPLLVQILGLWLGITVLRDLARFVQEYIVQATVWQGVMDLRCDSYNVALRVPVSFYAREGKADTMSRFFQDTSEVGRGQITLLGKTLAEPAKAMGSLAMALLLSWQLTLIVLIAGPPAFLLIGQFGKVMKRAARRALESWADILGVLEETLTGIRVVKTYTMESTERKRFFLANRRLLKQQRRIARLDAATAPAIESMGVAAGMVAAGAGGYFVLKGQIEPTDFFAWIGCLAGIFDPIRKLAKVVNRFQRAEAAATRVFELMDQEQERRTPGAPSLPKHSESLEFRGVHYRYPGATENALTGVDLRISAGQRVAIVGPNGCGKTTLVSLLPRLMEPQEGQVLIDGEDIAHHALRSLRRQIGLVTQDTVLFHATIAENIAYGLRRPTREKVVEAAHRAFVHEFVEDLPEGYDTMVGEQGATLSGGQKQRITIARAILRDPTILIFDEATSQVDADSEKRIHEAMEDFMAGRTTIMIAHRFSTVMSADRIVVMDAGRIVDDGRHEDLLQRCDLYRQLYETQLMGKPEAR